MKRPSRGEKYERALRWPCTRACPAQCPSHAARSAACNLRLWACPRCDASRGTGPRVSLVRDCFVARVCLKLYDAAVARCDEAVRMDQPMQAAMQGLTLVCKDTEWSSFPPQGHLEVACGGQAAFNDNAAELLQASRSQRGAGPLQTPVLTSAQCAGSFWSGRRRPGGLQRQPGRAAAGVPQRGANRPGATARHRQGTVCGAPHGRDRLHRCWTCTLATCEGPAACARPAQSRQGALSLFAHFLMDLTASQLHAC